MDIGWKKITMEDRALIEHYYEREQSMSCEFSFANNLLWAPYYDIRYAVLRDCLVFCHVRDSDTFSVSYPLGRGDIRGGAGGTLCLFCREKPAVSDASCHAAAVCALDGAVSDAVSDRV